MRFIDIQGGLRIPVSQEEQTLIEHIRKHQHVLRTSLGERQRELARKMVSRGVLNRGLNEDDQVFYVVNDLEDIWRS